MEKETKAEREQRTARVTQQIIANLNRASVEYYEWRDKWEAEGFRNARMKVINPYREFERRTITCKHCGWSGKGAAMEMGEAFGTGCDKHCPECGERYAFIAYPVIVADDAPDDVPAAD